MTMDLYRNTTPAPQHAITVTPGGPLRPGEAGWSDLSTSEDRDAVQSGVLTVVDDPFAGLTIDDTLQLVGDNHDLAARALKHEQQQPKKDQRSTLIDDLTRLSIPHEEEQ